MPRINKFKEILDSLHEADIAVAIWHQVRDSIAHEDCEQRRGNKIYSSPNRGPRNAAFRKNMNDSLKTWQIKPIVIRYTICFHICEGSCEITEGAIVFSNCAA